MTEKLSISLPPDMAAWLRELAAARRSNVSQVIRDAVNPMMVGVNNGKIVSTQRAR